MENILRLPNTFRFLLLWGFILSSNQALFADCITINWDSSTPTSCGGSDGTATFTVVVKPADCPQTGMCNGVPSFFYRVGNGSEVQFDPANPLVIQNLPSGNHTLTVTRYVTVGMMSNSCGQSSTPFIINPGGLMMSIGNPTASKCTSPTGAFTVTVSGGTPPYTVTVTGAPSQTTTSTASFTGLSAQTYTVTATDGTCTSSTSVAVPPIVVVNLAVSTQSVRCNGGSDGSITITQPPSADHSFSLSPANGTFSYPTFSGLPGLPPNNNYVVTATNTDSGCTATATVNVNPPSPLVVQTTVTNISCKGLTDGAITAMPTGGNIGTYTYAWSHSNSATTANVSSLSPGTYTVTVTDSKMCAATASATISDDAGADFTINFAPEITSGGSPNIKPVASTTGYRFNWNIVGSVNAIINPTPSSTNFVNNNTTIPQTISTDDMRSPGVVVYHLQIEKIPPNSSCKGRADTITVLIRPDTDADPFIPEIYTPNGDGQNDAWLVVMPDGVDKGEYTIFNRLGGKVYEGDTMTPWDGTGCPDGAYFYVLRYTQNGAEKVKKGAITILRTSN